MNSDLLFPRPVLVVNSFVCPPPTSVGERLQPQPDVSAARPLPPVAAQHILLTQHGGQQGSELRRPVARADQGHMCEAGVDTHPCHATACQKWRRQGTLVSNNSCFLSLMRSYHEQNQLGRVG